jgi:beta-glucosidase
MGSDIYPASLAGAVRYVHRETGVPVLVTEHGLSHDDDSLRAGLIPPALDALQDVIAEGVPVLGYVHWSLLDNFEWIFGFGPKLGLHAVDRTTFERTAKPSAAVYAAIAKANAVPS